MIRRNARWVIAAAVAITYAAISALRYEPALPNPLTVDLRIPAGRPGQAEPLIVDGRPGAGNFLYVRWTSPQTVSFGFDCWGHGGPIECRTRGLGSGLNNPERGGSTLIPEGNFSGAPGR